MKRSPPASKLDQFKGIDRLEAAVSQILSCFRSPESTGGVFNLSYFLLSDKELDIVLGKLFEQVKAGGKEDNNSKIVIWNVLLCHNRLARFSSLWTHKAGLSLQIRSLDLTDNALETIPPFVFELEHLEHLVVCRNKLTTLPQQIRRLQNLKVLNLSFNKVSEIDLGIFESLSRLKVVLLDENNLVQLPDDFGHLRDLECFSAQNNRLRGMPESAIYMKKVSSLNLEGNPLMQLWNPHL